MTHRVVAAAWLIVCASVPGYGQAVEPQPPPQIPRQATTPVPSIGTFGAPGMPPAPARPTTPSIQEGPGLQNPFLGGVPPGPATGTVIELGLSDAIERGLKYNLGLFLGEQGTRQAQAARLYARSGLLPTIVTETSDAGQQINLKALGFRGFPGVAPVVGPFNVFDVRAYASQNVFNLSAIRNWRSGNETLTAARYSYLDARDIVVLAVAGLYLQTVASRARIDTAQAQLKTATALYNQAVNMKAAGVVAGIDVVRAQVQMQAQQQRVIFFQNEFEKQKLTLARAIGLPAGQQLLLTDLMDYTLPPALTLTDALELAYANRSDYKSAQALVRALESARAAAVAERYPSLLFNGNYGVIGPRPWNSHGTFLASIGLNIPIFQAGRVQADILQADAQLEQQRARLADLRNAIDQEVRSSFLDLGAAGAQVEVARSAVSLAAQQLSQSQERYAAGVATSVEVVQGQEAVATAEENYISALFAYNLSKASLARSVGGAERVVLQFLRGTK